ncbi:MAG: hypothetical protein OXD42_08410 [Rhodospirillaceae bacterium]|nr:hypothetical protein [Rhodospirillaceae bacterium]
MGAHPAFHPVEDRADAEIVPVYAETRLDLPWPAVLHDEEAGVGGIVASGHDPAPLAGAFAFPEGHELQASRCP